MLTFDAATHTYTLGGQVIPSVTQLLGPLKDFSMVPPAVLERKRALGVAVHAAVAADVRGELDFGTMSDEVSGYVEGFWRWTAEYPKYSGNLDSKLVEVAFGHPKLKYAGTADIILDGLAVIDIKTRAPSMLTDSLQCAAYAELHKANGGDDPKEHWILSLSADGSYKFQRVNHKQSWSRFRFLLDHYNNAALIKEWTI